MNRQRTYIAIDLKSFYASVECVDRGLDALTTNLVVADKSRTDKTICLAVSPSLKKHGISGRARLFEVVQRVREVNMERMKRTRGSRLTGKSWSESELEAHDELAIDYIVAPPRMARYLEVSTQIYQVYLRYVAPEDIHPYSVDEVFIDATAYLDTYKLSAHELTIRMIREVLAETGITATAGIGSNLYLCKVAMDIVAKKMPADADGVRIAELDELSYRRLLWNHQPLTDFWRVGKGIARRLATYGITTMGRLARMSLTHEELLFKLFGVNAELLIDHAWGYEPCTMEMVKAYRPETNSLSSGQVLTAPYTYERARVVVQEMADSMALELVDKRMVTNQVVLDVGYDIESLTNRDIANSYHGGVVMDRYGRPVPKPSHGSVNLIGGYTSSSRLIIEATTGLFDRIANPMLMIRRITLTVNRVVREESVSHKEQVLELDIFSDYEESIRRFNQERAELERERKMQEALLSVKKRFGKNAVLKGLNYADGATAKERNQQIGGHKA